MEGSNLLPAGIRARSEVRLRRSPRAKLSDHEIATIGRLAAEHAVEVSARHAVRTSMARQATILAELAGAGVPFTMVAHRLALLAGTAAPAELRRRLAKALRKRRERAEATSGRLDLVGASPPVVSPPLRSAETTDAANGGEEMDMAQLVKRTITEEYTVDEDIDGVDMDDEDEDLEDEDEEAAPSRRSKR